MEQEDENQPSDKEDEQAYLTQIEENMVSDYTYHHQMTSQENQPIEGELERSDNYEDQGDYNENNFTELDQDDNEQHDDEDSIEKDQKVDGTEQNLKVDGVEQENIDDTEYDLNANGIEQDHPEGTGQDQNVHGIDQFQNVDGINESQNVAGIDQFQNVDGVDESQDVDGIHNLEDYQQLETEKTDKNTSNSEDDTKLEENDADDESNSNRGIENQADAARYDQTQLTAWLIEPDIDFVDTSPMFPEETADVVNLDATATVKFMLMPSGQVVTLACTLGQTLESLKSHFASELKMPSSVIVLMFDGTPTSDSTTLAELGVSPNGTIQLEMQSADPVNNPLKPYRSRQEYHMPDVITVRVITEDCEAKDVVVEIERSRTKKPFLGGFRNKNTGVEFHNASAQTMKKPRPPPTSERFCRDTQTCEQRNTRQQTFNNTSTQATGIGVYISNLQDKLISPGSYLTADDYWAMILSKVIILQKYFRRWLAIRYVKKLKEDKEKRLEWEWLEELRKKKEKEERIQREYARRINPKTKADFDRLINCLEKWRTEEIERINSTLDGAERKAAMCMLLDQETELLSAIERHKNEANYDNRAMKIMNFLEKAAAPKVWQAHDGKLTYMDTPFTIRAKELRDIYNSINMKYLTQDERLDVLLTLKHTVKEHDCKLTQEIIELIDREADLLMRGVKESNLTGLRKRICTLYLQYIKTPTFNPEAAKFLKVPQDASTLRKNINYCRSCGCYLPSTDFFVTTNSRNAGRCRRCQKIENEGRQREDHTYYRVMLKALHKSEEAMQDGSTLCYLLKENDLRYLVENIWSNQSVLSAWNDPYDLVLCRWNKHQEWSPWNCILLTHDEAEAHKKLFSLEEGYGHVFIHKVTQKHNFARNYFSRLPGMAEILHKKMVPQGLKKPEAAGVVGHSAPKVQKV